jgi:hypothetical protein
VAGMNIGMKKFKEDEAHVFYQFKTKIYEKTDDDYVLVEKFGYCRFNKETAEFILLENTDPYFLEKDNREVIKVRCKLLRIKRDGEPYLEITGIATG